MARDTTAARAKATQGNTDAINRQLEKIRELQDGVEALKEKEAIRLFGLMERAGWFEVTVPDKAFVAAMSALVDRHRGGADRAAPRDAVDAPATAS